MRVRLDEVRAVTETAGVQFAEEEEHKTGGDDRAAELSECLEEGERWATDTVVRTVWLCKLSEWAASLLF